MMFMQGTKKERPLTHDLLASILRAFEAKIERVIVNDFKRGIYFARLILSAENESQERKIIEMDSRPGECIAMATQQTARIYVSRKGSENANSRVVERRINTFLHTAYRAANPPLTRAFVTSYDSWLDYCSVAVLNFPLMAQEEIPPREPAPFRKVIQISSMTHQERDWAFIALCDDGSLWLYHGSWSQIENVPQTTDLSQETRSD